VFGVFAALDAVVLLGEPLTLRLLLASAAILCGIALVVVLGVSNTKARASDENG